MTAPVVLTAKARDLYAAIAKELYMSTPEGKVKNAIKAYLKEIGAYYYMPVPMGYGAKSVDFFVCWRGWFVAIEAKRPDGPGATKNQQDVLDEVAQAGGGTIVAHTLQDVKDRFFQRMHSGD